MHSLQTFELTNWDVTPSSELQQQAIEALENGKVLYFPMLPFELSDEELNLLSPSIIDPKSKNISYNIQNDRLAGTTCKDDQNELLKSMIRRYAATTRQLLHQILPHYNSSLVQGKTSLRTVEIAGRQSSYRKDDTRLHVDAFPSNPNRGKRILRVFTNINHEDKPRVWRTGEPFPDVVAKIAPRVSHPIIGLPTLLRMLGITKDVRSPYDHYMLKIHDTMKGDETYQKNAPQEEVRFPPGSTWIVYTDQVSHAAMAGQHVLEQTFHIPVQGLQNPNTAPLRILEKHFAKALV